MPIKFIWQIKSQRRMNFKIIFILFHSINILSNIIKLFKIDLILQIKQQNNSFIIKILFSFTNIVMLKLWKKSMLNKFE